jgi:hypothetical protein
MGALNIDTQTKGVNKMEERKKKTAGQIIVKILFFYVFATIWLFKMVFKMFGFWR